MKITKIEDFHADGGYRTCSYLKVSTDSGLVGWSEYYDSFSGSGISGLIGHFSNVVAGMDPTKVGLLSANLHATTRLAAGGVNHQAIAAIENACLDIQGKALGVPVCQLFGGPFRDRLELYWTHCGSYRVRHAEFYEKQLGLPPIRTLDDLVAVGKEAVKLGYKTIKTNPVFFDKAKPEFFNGGFRIAPGILERNPSRRYVSAIEAELEALRDGLGPDIGLMLDISFSQRTEGYLRIAKAVERFDLTWLELDTPDPKALELIRRSTSTPIASLESLYGQREYRGFLDTESVDVCIIDPIWNGVWQSVRIAALADAYETNIAPHNPVGDLANLMSAHFAAAVPNFRILEYRADEAPWIKDFLTHPPVVEDGTFVLPTRPGWGSDINEEALKAYPPRRRG
jgi:galactonate dehydratase